MKRIVALSLATVALVVVTTAGAMATIRELKPGARFDFRGITCVTKSANHDSLVCFSSSSPYAVTIGKKAVTVIRSKNGKVVYATPGQKFAFPAPKPSGRTVLELKKGSEIDYRGITCITREANYNVLACVSKTSPYAVSVGLTSIVVTKDSDGRMLYFSS